MTTKEMKRLSRADLLEMLIDQGTELQQTRQQLTEAQCALDTKRIAIDNAGDIAEAALQLNGVFDAAQAACSQYMENIRELNERQEEIRIQREQEIREHLLQVEAECAQREQKLRDRMLQVEAACAQREQELRDHLAETEAEVARKEAELQQQITDMEEETAKKRQSLRPDRSAIEELLVLMRAKKEQGSL